MNKTTDKTDTKTNTQKPKAKPRGAFSKMVTILVILLVLAFSAWGAVKLVKVFPDTVDSLASIADTVYDYNPKEEVNLEIKSDRNTLNSGEKVVLWWDKVKSDKGTYAFSYECKEGLSVDIRYQEKDFLNVDCNNSYDLGSTEQMEIRINSEKDRFSELSYTVSYFGKNDTSAKLENKNKLTIVNPLITDQTYLTEDEPNNDTPPEAETTEQKKDSPKQTNEEKEVDHSVPTESDTAVKQEPVYVYEVPTSNPNGYTDLVLSKLKTGFVTVTNTFYETDALTKDTMGAIQFTVHNIGNKTSENWTFKAELPNGENYASKEQTALKPNERAVLTIQFPVTADIGLETITVFTQTKRDNNINNNYLEKIVTVTE